jgi:hypothetical protein
MNGLCNILSLSLHFRKANALMIHENEMFQVKSYVQFFAFLLVFQFIPNIRFCRIFIFTEYSVFTE